ncbi:hypothetical protein ABZS53_15290 [Streptomyces sp. NPDC005499]|uniref:hypothetical protein n=1 Tax=Streptomyces sp. NPDC005499 TaxID=3154883 RepID=UPI0033A431F3
MSQPPLHLDQLLARAGRIHRASLPQRTPEEKDRDLKRSRDRLAASIKTHLDANNAVACALCHAERPRRDTDEPLFYPSDECENADKHWHYPRDWTQPPATRAKNPLRRILSQATEWVKAATRGARR